jgi:hypothetical protein
MGIARDDVDGRMTRIPVPRLQFYILLGKLAVPESDGLKWGRWFQTANRIVFQTRIGGVEVSTVFLGFDHGYGENEFPILFETMIFRGGSGEECWRCASWDEAEAQHKEAVALVRNAIKEKVND